MNIRKLAQRRFQHRARQIIYAGQMIRYVHRLVQEHREKAPPPVEWGQFIDSLLEDTRRRNELAALVEAPTIEEPPVVENYTVVRKSTGEIVAEFDRLEDAEALIEKHRRQKRAALCMSTDYLMSI